MSIGRLILATSMSTLLLLSSAAQEPQAPPSEEAAPDDAGQAAPSQPDRDEPRTLEEIFIPSEEIAADEEVTFPINI